jgi:hypothetical protein
VLNVYWSKCGPRAGNFGDKLTSLILDYLNVPHQWTPASRADIFGIGSIVEAIPDGFSGIVWTSGQIHESTRKDLRQATVLALRGRETLCRTLATSRDVPLGDGGLLIDLLYRPTPKKYKLGLIPHYVDARDAVLPMVAATSREITVIDICGNTLDVIQRVGECEFILSSSLHGLITADSLGIPADWMELSSAAGIIGGGFKFADYFTVFGVTDKEPIRPKPSDRLDTLLPRLPTSPRPGLDAIKAQLLETVRSLTSGYGTAKWKDDELGVVTRHRKAVARLDPAFQPGPADTPLTLTDPLMWTDADQLAALFAACVELLRHLRSRGVAHRAITAAHLGIREAKPVLTGFGWAALEDEPLVEPYRRDGATADGYGADLRAIGRVLAAFVVDPMWKGIAQLVSDESDRRVRIADLDVLDAIIGALRGKSAETASVMAIRHLALGSTVLADRARTLEHTVRGQADRLWHLELELACREIADVVPEGHSFALVDDGHFADRRIVEGRAQRPFTDVNGQYAGPPIDGRAALLELERLIELGTHFLVFVSPAFWWLDHYVELRSRLTDEFRCVLANDRVNIFDLRGGAAANRPSST